MSVAGKFVSTAWLLGVILSCGCSNNPSKTTIQTVDGSQKGTSGQKLATGSGEQTTASAISPADADPILIPASDDADPAKSEPKDLVTQLKDLQNKQLRSNDRETVLAHLNKMLDVSEQALATKLEPNDRDEVRQTAVQVVAILAQIDPKRRELLDKVDKLTEEALSDTPDGPTAATALLFRVVAHLHVEGGDGAADPAVNKRLFELAKDFAAAAPKDDKAMQILFTIEKKATADDQDDLRLEVLKHIAKIDPDGQYGQMATGKVTLIETMGKPPEIAGPTLDGTDIDISQFKGKVVLVDFWATWCGPCVGELPNVRRVYDKYHDEGFEVIAVSFDDKKASLERFVAENKLPWPQIFFDEDGKRYWENPLGRKYGIDGIPATFLVDRDGNLKTTGVRGEELEPAVVELLKAKDNQ